MGATGEAVKLIGSGAVGIILGVLGAAYADTLGYLHEDRELDIRMVDISLGILRGERGDNDAGVPARRYAIRMLAEFSGVYISPDETEKWAKGDTPFREQVQPRYWHFSHPTPGCFLRMEYNPATDNYDLNGEVICEEAER